MYLQIYLGIVVTNIKLTHTTLPKTRVRKFYHKEYNKKTFFNKLSFNYNRKW